MNEYDLDKIGNFLATRRKKLNIKQNELAEMIGTTYKTISKWENGRGFPDLILQKSLCDSLKITLDELHSGKIDNFNRLKSIVTYLLSIICIILLPISVIFLKYYSNNHKEPIYQVEGINNNGEYNLKGLLIKKDNKYIFNIGYIKYTNYSIKGNDIVSINIFQNDKLIFHTNQPDYFYLALNSNDIKSFNNLSYVININNEKEEKGTINIIQNQLSQTEIINEDNSYKNKIIIERLIAEGFKEEKNNQYTKSYIENNEKYMIRYLSLERILNIQIENKNTLKNIQEYFDINLLEINIFERKNNIRTIIERYTYDFESEKINCEIGLCTTIYDIKNFLKKYNNLLNVE